jgi:DNA topoisomerase I
VRLPPPRFRFRGKSGRQHEVGIRDRRLAAVVRKCQDLPGQELFQYIGEDGVSHDVASGDVNEYLREISGADVTAKDFRTWAGTVLAYRALRALAPGTNDRAVRKNVVEAVRFTSDHLGNTPAVARRSYVHPAILEAYMDGSIGGALLEAAEDQVAPPSVPDPREERQVVALLRKRLAESKKAAKPGTRRRAKRATAATAT